MRARYVCLFLVDTGMMHLLTTKLIGNLRTAPLSLRELDHDVAQCNLLSEKDGTSARTPPAQAVLRDFREAS